MGSDSATSVTFLLLVFFLVAASVSASHNLTEHLPPPPRGSGRRGGRSGIGRHGILRVCLGVCSRLVIGNRVVGIRRLETGAGRFITGGCGSRSLPRGASGRISFFNPAVIARGRMISLRGSHSSSCRTCVSMRGRLITTCGRLESRLSRRG